MGLPLLLNRLAEGTPRPLNSPPFPSADWSIGGTIPIGVFKYPAPEAQRAKKELQQPFLLLHERDDSL